MQTHNLVRDFTAHVHKVEMWTKYLAPLDGCAHVKIDLRHIQKYQKFILSEIVSLYAACNSPILDKTAEVH